MVLNKSVVISKLLPALFITNYLSVTSEVLGVGRKPNELGAVTYELIGRFGDNLLSYMHAKWLSLYYARKGYNLPVLYKPFLFSNQLRVHDIEKGCSRERLTSLHRIISLKNHKWTDLESNSHVLYEIPYFPYDLEKEPGNWTAFPVDWKDPEFKRELKRVVHPRFALPKFELLADKITVAIHVRRGGSFEELNLGFPFKFPDDSYYVEQLGVLDRLLGHRPLYVFIFTDDREPLKILADFQKRFEQFSHITFDCRRTKTDHNLNVLEDFFALTKFDCLIRPDSNFSVCAAKISDYLVEIEPKKCYVEDHKAIISEVNIVIDEELCKKRDILLQKLT